MYLKNPKMVSSPLADFTKLPYTDGHKDFNFQQPFVGDGIIHHPFSDENLMLQEGFHLHFILPHLLGQQTPANALSQFSNQLPPAPNRWLVHNGEHTWLIESDYVYDENTIPQMPSAVIPYNNPAAPFSLPYRYMGRTSLLGERRTEGDTFKSMNPSNKALTSYGFGDPNFSSFYPNCLGVFGFVDSSPTLGASYQILGWNADAEDDVLLSSMQGFLNQPSIQNTSIQQFLKDNFKLDMGETNPSADFRTLYYGEIIFDSTTSPSAKSIPDVHIAIGNTGTEAISAIIASLNGTDDASKKKMEEQLESIILKHKLSAHKMDIGAKFVEARHDKGFKASHSGHIWKISHQKQQANTAATSQNLENNADSGNSDLPILPDELAKALNNLNLAQYALDQATHHLITLKQQAYHDWFKYMLAAYPPLEGRGQYPDPDHLRYFIENFSLKEIDDQETSIGSYTLDEINGTATPSLPNATDLSNAFCKHYEAVQKILKTENDSRNSKQAHLYLSMIAGPRFWEPTQPVVLISGLNLSEADKDISLNSDPNYLTTKQISSTFNLLSTETSAGIGDVFQRCSGISQQVYSQQTWDPFILDWQASLLDANLLTQQGAFDPLAIENNFSLHQFSPDFKKNDFKYGNVSVFSGSALMSTSARQAMLVQLRKFIADYMNKWGISFQLNPQKDNEPYALDDFLEATDSDQALDKIVAPKEIDTGSDSPLFTARNAYLWLLNNKVITQALGGFNSASIMLRKSAQLPINEPLGFEDARAFTQKVAGMVQHNQDTSPIMAFDFNPIRSGKMAIERLSLIDNFGVATELSLPNTPVVAETMKDNSGDLFLQPRIVQASRLNFRWLSADPISSDENRYEDEVNVTETNDHLKTSPVCGWLMANYFNDGTGNSNTLAGEANILGVYDKDGLALGYLDGEATWNLMPWISGPCDVDANIENAYLRNLIKWLTQNFTANFSDFIKTTQVALNTIAPAHSSTFDVKSIMMGRPMAVVRSRVSLQLKGKAAIDQGWSSILMDLNNCDSSQTPYTYESRNKNGWTQVKFPIRIGEHHQLNDGVVVYWTENDAGEFIKLYAPETSTNDVNDAQIDAFDGSNQILWQKLNDTPVNMTMLMDPRGLVHANCGFLPTKAISIPPAYCIKAMQNISMWFAVSPILQPVNNKNELFMNLPSVPGYEWKWWDNFNGTLTVADDAATKNMHQENQLIEGWLVLNPLTES